MGKNFKKVLGMLLCAVMVVGSLTGCGKKSDEEILVSSLAASTEPKSVEADMTLSGKISVSGTDIGNQDSDMSISAHEVIFTEPMKAKITMTTSAAGMNTTIEEYMQQDGSDYVMYINYGLDNASQQSDDSSLVPGWYKMKLSGVDDAMNQINMDTLKQLATDSSKYKKLEEKEENGKKYQLYEYSMETDNLKGELEKYMGNFSSVTGGSDELEEIYNTILDSIGTVTMTLWIDTEEEKIYKIEYPMTDLMNGVFDSIFSGDSSEKSEESLLGDTKISVSDMNMVITYKNYGSAEEFEIPSEALDAAELDMGSMTTDSDSETETNE